MALEPIRNRRIYSQIADQIRDLIASGVYRPGSYLPPERDLATSLGVSRSSVREALIALEVLGLVDVRVGDGVLVRAIPPAEAQGDSLMRRVMRLTRPGPDPELPVALDLDVEIPPFALLQARRLVEPEAAALAARRATSADIAAIEAAFAQNVADNRARSTTHPGDRMFHIRIAQASGNAAFEQFMIVLLGHAYGGMFRRLQSLYTTAEMIANSESQHAAILDSIRAGSEAGARDAMIVHLDMVIDVFLRE
ncbi:FadR/GntR family transcriptional regulator [Acidiphilium iwatense]|uniref:FadR family transcriptional regulator n=1 Tax=Acidiphilium iwatense TaxID=768198 RepID=A0ABS9DWT9_9PROT|nr:FadR/GntR family transcriptional regulator [Acidiphilium iwatense]MCF3946608.1 FadR family transcriptional regulator [Acidiphilium iwatense]